VALLAVLLAILAPPAQAGGLGSGPGAVAAGSDLAAPGEAGTRAADPLLYFPETGFGIDEPRFADYFARRGRLKTFGFPTSRTFQLLGLRTQFFQRSVLQIGPDGNVRSLNLLDPGLLPYTRINGSTFPAPDERLAAAAPSPDRPNYGASIVDFVRRNAPETFNGQPVRFFTTFNTSVTLADAYPGGGGDAALLPLLNLEIWGVPTSAPVQDPNNNNFIYQRFQRGIMHYDVGCRCTQGLLLADYFKALITGEGLPPDLEEQARSSPFFRTYSPDRPNGLSRRATLPNTDLREAFARQDPPVAVTPPTTGGPARTRIRADQALWGAVDALETAEDLAPLNAIIQSDTQLGFGDLPEGVHARYTRLDQRGGGAPTRSIAVSNRWRASDPKALATIIAHEGQHLADDLAGIDARGLESCIQSEIRAFTEQSVLWQAFYGPTGKEDPRDELDAELNAWLALYRRGPAELEQRIRQLYAQACA
jgi:hypothetical protein